MESWPDSLDQLKAAGFLLVATTLAADAVCGVRELDPGARPRRRVLGTEGHGLSDETFDHADVRVRIPMSGALDSLNVATAAGIVLQRISEASLVPGRRSSPTDRFIEAAEFATLHVGHVADSAC